MKRAHAPTSGAGSFAVLRAAPLPTAPAETTSATAVAATRMRAPAKTLPCRNVPAASDRSMMYRPVQGGALQRPSVGSDEIRTRGADMKRLLLRIEESRGLHQLPSNRPRASRPG